MIGMVLTAAAAAAADCMCVTARNKTQTVQATEMQLMNQT